MDNQDIRLDEEGNLDEVIVSGKVHLEYMDKDHVWIGITKSDGHVLHINLESPCSIDGIVEDDADGKQYGV